VLPIRDKTDLEMAAGSWEGLTGFPRESPYSPLVGNPYPRSHPRSPRRRGASTGHIEPSAASTLPGAETFRTLEGSTGPAQVAVYTFQGTPKLSFCRKMGDMLRAPHRRVFRIRNVFRLTLFASLWPTLGVFATVDEGPSSDAVRMEPVEVKSDPFRTLGGHGTIVVKLPGGVHMYVSAVNPASPCARSGLRADDEIIELAGKPVGLRTLFSFRKLVDDSLNHGTSFACLVRSYHREGTHPVVLQAMREPRHKWLPLVRSAAAPSAPRDPLPHSDGSVMPEGTWKNRGSPTPEAALESLFCELDHGAPDWIAGMIEVPRKSQAELFALFGSLTDSGRGYYGNPERMLAALVDQETRPRWIQIRKVSASHADWVSLKVALQFWGDFDHRLLVLDYRFHRAATGWRWAISSDSVSQYIQYYRGVPFELAAADEVPAIAWSFRSN